MTSSAVSTTPPVSPRPGFAAALGSAAFCTLWLSEAISLIGDRILMVALVNLVYERSASSAAVGLLAVIKAVPALALGALAGILVDRWSRKWIMVASNLLLFALVMTFPSIENLPLLFAVYFGMAVISQFFIPARSATIPSLVPEAGLLAANSLFAMAFVGAIAAGPAIGGWISDRFGLQAAFYLDGLTFLAPALAVACLRIPAAGRAGETHDIRNDWRQGLTLIKARPEMRIALLLGGAAMLLVAALSALGVIIVRQRLGGSAGDFGWLMSACGTGMLAGAGAAAALGKRFDRQRLACAGAALGGAAMIALALAPALNWGLACAFLLGLGFVTVQVNTQTTLQTAPEQLRGRVLGLSQTVTGSVTFVVAGLAGLLAGWLGAAPVLIGAGAICAGLAILTLIRYTI